MTTKQKAVIFDIDGVLAKISKNEDGTPKRGYHNYDKVDLDEPIERGFDLIRIFYNCYFGKAKIIFVTGRKEFCREKTLTWIDCELQKTLHSLYLNTDFLQELKWWNIFMRPDSDHRPAVELKKEIYETQIKDKYNVIMAFDDDPEVCKMYKEQGILTLQVMTRN